MKNPPSIPPLSINDRDLARAALRRFTNASLSRGELASEIERWEQHRDLLHGALRAGDDSLHDEPTLRGGIAYAEMRLSDLDRQAASLLRAGTHQRDAETPDFARARLADLVGLVESLGHHPRKAGQNWLMRCPFHDDGTASLTIYPPGRGWHCFGCGRGGQDAASFAAEHLHGSQLDGLLLVEQMCDVPGVNLGAA